MTLGLWFQELTGILSGSIPVWVVLAWAAFMSVVQALPRPAETSPQWYVFVYQFVHALSANWARVFDPKKKSPEPDDKG